MANKNFIIKCVFFIFIISYSFPVQAKTVAILPFEVLSDKSEYKQFGIGTMDTISVALTGIPDFTMIDRGRLTLVLKEQSLQNSGFSNVNDSVKVGKLIGAEILVTGSIQSFDNQFRITASYIDVETGKIIKATKVTGTNIFELQDKIADQLMELENVKLSPEQRNEVTKITQATNSNLAFDSYTIGRTLYYKLIDIIVNNNNDGVTEEQQLAMLNETLGYFNKAIEIDNNYFLAIASKAETQAFLYGFYVTSNNYKDSKKGIEFLKQADENSQLAFKMSKNSGSVYRALAFINHMKGDDITKTIEYSLKAIEYNPADREAYLWLSISYFSYGYTLFEKENFAEAAESFQHCIQYLPNFKNAYIYLDKIYNKINDIDKAIDNCEKALLIQWNKNEVSEGFIKLLISDYQLKANEYYKKADFINLEKTYNSMIKYQAKNPDLYNNLAIAYFMQKKYDNAEEAYKKAIDISPSNPNFYNNLGLLYQSKGNKDLADSLFKKSCDLGNKSSCK